MTPRSKLDRNLNPRRLALPAKPVVVDIKYNFHEDSTGYPAICVRVMPAKKTRSSQRGWAKVEPIHDAIRDSLRAEDVEEFPYIRLRAETEWANEPAASLTNLRCDCPELKKGLRRDPARELCHESKGQISMMNQINLIHSVFPAVIGSAITRYETVELLHDDGAWSDWPDLPICLHTDAGREIRIAWSEFDQLWIAMDSSLPFSIEGSTVRWVENSIETLNPSLGGTIRCVKLGRGEMTIEGVDIEIWARLLIQVGDGWLEIFNALDENGYDFHTEFPPGKFVDCV